MWHNLFICAILQMILNNRFLQVGRAFWHKWMAQWLPERQLRMHLSLVSGVRLEKLYTSGSPDIRLEHLYTWVEDQSLKIVFCCSQWQKFIRNTVRLFPKFSMLRLVIFFGVCSISPHMTEWKYFILSSSVSWLWIFKLVWNRPWNSSNFCDFPSKVGMVVVRDLVNFYILLMFLLKSSEILFVANCLKG